jgi:hypothetical protein
MLRFWNGKGRWISGGVFLTIALTCVLLVLNEKVTTWIGSGDFRDMLNRETSKGLKLRGQYPSFFRVGLLGMHADSFDGANGYKTIVSLHANDISGTFNPLGIALRRWELDDLHIKSGSVMLQKTEATPEANKGRSPIPWWALFWPYRVHLADVKVDDANILWQLRGKESGIYGTFVEITPNGRDFEYDAHGGAFKTPITPHLEVRHAHVLIRKPRLYCSEFLLGDDAAHPEQQVRVDGDAGLQEDRSIKLKIDLASLNVSPWMPEKLRLHVIGHASGHFDYASSGTGLETAVGHGNITIANGILRGLAPVRQYITITGSPDPGDLALKVCQADLRWQECAMTAENIKLECEGVFRLEGTMTIAKDQTLSGNIELGLTDEYLHWLPTARQTIFTREEGLYHFTTIHLSGTAQKPEQDLSGRIAKEVEKSPLIALKLFFNQAGEWFDLE